MTNSRDTQELLPDAGQEMLRIFFTHPARTSLLQDFAFYEVCVVTLLFSPCLRCQPLSSNDLFCLGQISSKRCKKLKLRACLPCLKAWHHQHRPPQRFTPRVTSLKEYPQPGRQVNNTRSRWQTLPLSRMRLNIWGWPR